MAVLSPSTQVFSQGLEHRRDLIACESLCSGPVRGRKGTQEAREGNSAPLPSVPLAPCVCPSPWPLGGFPPPATILHRVFFLSLFPGFRPPWVCEMVAAWQHPLGGCCAPAQVSPPSSFPCPSLLPSLLTCWPPNSFPFLILQFGEQSTPAALRSLSKTQIPACALLSFS